MIIKINAAMLRTKQIMMKISSGPCRLVANLPAMRTSVNNTTIVTRTTAPAMKLPDLLSCDRSQITA